MNKKIKSLNELKKIISKKKSLGKKIVLCHGVFDLLHFGHLQHFKKAKTYGDILVVTVTQDQHINKGPNRPFFNSQIRKNLLAELSVIDYVSEVNGPSAKNSIISIKPDFYIKGQDYKKKEDVTGKIDEEIKEVKKYGGKTIYTNEVVFSSTKLLNLSNLTLNKEQTTEIRNIKKKYDFRKIKIIFNKLRNLKVLVLGEFIIDKYTFCEALGKSGKDPIMMFKRNHSEEYLGGVAAIANNLISYVKKVEMISCISSLSDINHIKYQFNKRIKKIFIKLKSTPTIRKEKFIDIYSGAKLIGFYDFDDKIQKIKEEKKIFLTIKKQISNYDLVIVADYDHGMISSHIAKFISRKVKKLYVTTQINAANILHHDLKKFPKTFCIVVNEAELRHHFRNKIDNLELLIKKYSTIINAQFIVVTRGAIGSILYDVKGDKIYGSASYAKKIVDKIGAGDTLLALFSIFFHISKDPQLSLFISSVGAGKNVENMANSKSIEKATLLKLVEHLV